ncbi:MAG: hypothetical protein DBY39_01365 [Clostridiales bacterium]|nr:MAG: hypothetical protein DBY39_01365 [Clostridiales bacterium]
MPTVQPTAGDLEIISQNPLFSGFSLAEISQLLQGRCTISCHEKHARLDTGDQLGLLLYGRACIQQTGEHGAVLDYIAPPRVFGLASIYLEHTQLSEIYALTRLRMLCLARNEVDILLEESARFRTNFLRYLSTRVAFLTDKLERLSTMSAEDRLFSYLQKQADEEGHYTVRSMTEFAALLNISRASLYRAIEQLEQRGALSHIGKQFTLLSQHP